MIPWLIRLVPSMASRTLLVVAFAAVALLYTYLRGVDAERARWEALAARQEAEMLRAVERAARIQDRVIYRYIDRWRTVVQRGETIVREIPKYITVEADARCIVPRGFVRVHDAGAANAPLSAASGPSDAEDSGLALSTVADTVTSNYQQAHETRVMCEALQQWAAEVSAPNPPAPAPRWTKRIRRRH